MDTLPERLVATFRIKPTIWIHPRPSGEPKIAASAQCSLDHSADNVSPRLSPKPPSTRRGPFVVATLGAIRYDLNAPGKCAGCSYEPRGAFIFGYADNRL
jgi:hypothetical protein